MGPPALPSAPPQAVPSAPVVAPPPDDPGATPAEPTGDPAVAPVSEATPEPEPPVATPEAVREPAPPPELESPWPREREPDDGYVTIRPPRWNGTGLLVSAGVMFASAIAFQAGDSALCGDCAIGVIERAFLSASMGLSAGGGVVRGHATAYDDTALRRARPNTRAGLIAGSVLVGAGAVIGLVNEGLWWRCVLAGRGPYVLPPDGDDFFAESSCRVPLDRALLDVASASAATGLGVLGWSLTYRRDAKAYQRARVIGLRPQLGPDRLGVGVGGRF